LLSKKGDQVSADVDDISRLLERIHQDRGFDFTQYRENTVRRRIGRRMTARNCSDIPSYLRLLDSDHGEYDLLLRDLTVKYTEFFRDPFVFGVLREGVLPDILSGREFGGHLRIWSAGCATGEEAYSLAILIRQMQAGGECRCPTTILATDIDEAAIRTARAGSYRKHMLPTLPDERAMRFFSDDGATIEALPEIREMVSFQVHDLLSDDEELWAEHTPHRHFDLVLCRNVLIYLKRLAQVRLLDRLVDTIGPGGYLVIGTGESIPDHLRTCLEPLDRQAKVYRLAQGSAEG